MATDSSISWTGHSYNPWWSCHEVSPGCAHCYARTLMLKFGKEWHKVARTGDATFYAPLKKWHAPDFVFTCSMGDFMHADADEWRPEVWDNIRRTSHLTYQILTKRIERAEACLPPDWGDGYANVWLGTSIENDRFVHRADILRRIPALVRFISYEPALSAVPSLDLAGIDWLICGGESGPGYRPMQLEWAREIRDRCLQAGVAFWFKQSNGIRSEMGKSLDGERWEQYPDVPSLPPQYREKALRRAA